MSEPENFIARWSRRKRAAAEDAEATKSSAAPDATAESAHPREDQSDALRARSGAPEPSEPAFDPTKLPPIETITAESDIRAFLAPGVPPELTRVALRRAWAADPKIRDFIGLSENAWDFNVPGAMTGFGSLEMTDELRRQVARMVGRSLAGEATDRPTQSSEDVQRTPSRAETSTESAAARGEGPAQEVQSNVGTARHRRVGEHDEQHSPEPLPQCSKVDIASQNNLENADNDQLIAKRSQGRALPKRQGDS